MEANYTAGAEIKSIYLYRWIHKRGKRIYPSSFTLAERKLRYFGMIERGDKDELARKMYWSDFKTNRVKAAEFEYQHMRDIKKALEILNISEKEMNENYLVKKVWEKKIREKKVAAFEKWCNNKENEYITEKLHQATSGEFKKDVQKLLEKSKDNKWRKWRPLPR